MTFQLAVWMPIGKVPLDLRLDQRLTSDHSLWNLESLPWSMLIQWHPKYSWRQLDPNLMLSTPYTSSLTWLLTEIIPLFFSFIRKAWDFRLEAFHPTCHPALYVLLGCYTTPLCSFFFLFWTELLSNTHWNLSFLPSPTQCDNSVLLIFRLTATLSCNFIHVWYLFL